MGTEPTTNLNINSFLRKFPVNLDYSSTDPDYLCYLCLEK